MFIINSKLLKKIILKYINYLFKIKVHFSLERERCVIKIKIVLYISEGVVGLVRQQ